MMCRPMFKERSITCLPSFFLSLVHWGGVGYVLHKVPEVKVG